MDERTPRGRSRRSILRASVLATGIVGAVGTTASAAPESTRITAQTADVPGLADAAIDVTVDDDVATVTHRYAYEKAAVDAPEPCGAQLAVSLPESADAASTGSAATTSAFGGLMRSPSASDLDPAALDAATAVVEPVADSADGAPSTSQATASTDDTTHHRCWAETNSPVCGTLAASRLSFDRTRGSDAEFENVSLTTEPATADEPLLASCPWYAPIEDTTWFLEAATLDTDDERVDAATAFSNEDFPDGGRVDAEHTIDLATPESDTWDVEIVHRGPAISRGLLAIRSTTGIE